MPKLSLEDVRKTVRGIRIVDSHEHLPPEEERIRAKTDSLTFFVNSGAQLDDLFCSGMSQEAVSFICDTRIPVNKRWPLLKPYLEKIRNTGYTKAFEIAMADIYGVKELNLKSFVKLTERMERAKKIGFYEWVLRDKAKIDYVMNQDHLFQLPAAQFANSGSDCILPIALFDGFVFVKNRMDLDELSRQTGTRIHSLQDLLRVTSKHFRKIKSQVVGLKFTLAYQRTLKFDDCSFEDAEKGFREVAREEPPEPEPKPSTGAMIPVGPNSESLDNETKSLQDYLMKHVLQLNEEYGLPVQFHAGLLGGNGNFLDHSNPVHLSNLFIRHKRTKFIILHCFPYCDELGALAKMFSNVYVDMAWFHMISPKSAKLALAQWIDLLPINKILAFGGDEGRVEVCYGHSVIARETVAEVLWEKARCDSLSLERVTSMAQRLLRENAWELFLSGQNAEQVLRSTSKIRTMKTS